MSMNVNSPDKWDANYEQGTDGWDLGGPAPAFTQLAASGRFTPGPMLVPGDGRGHDAREFARHGFSVTAVDFTAYAVLAGVAGGLALIVWWLFFSRAGWYERVGVLALMIAAMAATWPFLDVSISTGAMGFLFPMLAIPGLCLAFVLWAVASRRMSVGLRRTTLVAAIVLSCGVWTLIRTGGFTGGLQRPSAAKILVQTQAYGPPPRSP